jgi:hypothetical protein
MITWLSLLNSLLRWMQWCKIHRNFQYLHPSMHPASRVLWRKAKS